MTNVPRQPNALPASVPSGTPTTLATVKPAKTMLRANPRRSGAAEAGAETAVLESEKSWWHRRFRRRQAQPGRAGTDRRPCWPSKAAVVLEALTTRTAVEVAAPDTGSVQEDVQSLLRSAFAVLRSGRQKVVLSLMAEAQLSEEFAVAFREQFISRRRKALTDLIQRGIERGQLEADVDVEFLADMIYGPMWYRLLNRHAPIDDAFADRLSAFVLGRATDPRSERKRR
jgi:Tetracyclin repressor-like, C-terminal domain